MPLTKPSIENDALMARYPFLPQGNVFLKIVLEKNGITVNDLIENPLLEEVRARGRVRLLESVSHKEGVDSATRIDLFSEAGKMIESLSFLYAMFVVCASFNERLLARWVEGEASRADQLFGMDQKNFNVLAKSYISDVKEVSEKNGEKTYWVPISDFIELCPRISGNYWRLINRPVENGWVCMNSGSGETSQQRTARLIKERIREHLTNSCLERMNKMDDAFAELFLEPVEIVSKLLSEQVKEEMPMSAAIREDWPPCFESAVAELSQGVNVNHTGSLFLASMSLAMGISQEQACGFFVNAPDYSAETTNYQINQIYESKYTPHGCAALKTGARCPVSPGDDWYCDQEWLKHPLSYLRAKQRRRFQENGEGETREENEEKSLNEDNSS